MNIGLRKSIITGGKEISVETGKLAKQADGSVVVRMGDTMLLATVVAAADALFSVLMGEDVEKRRAFIQRNAKDVRFLDI